MQYLFFGRIGNISSGWHVLGRGLGRFLLASLWLCASGPATSAHGSVLGLAPPPPALLHPAASLSRDQIFRRIDALEEIIHHGESERVQSLFELAVLESSTGRIEDRRHALELFERLTWIAPDRLDVVLWRARVEIDQKAFLPALTHLRGARARFGEVAALEHAIGYAAWLDGRRRLKASSLATTLRAFRRAHELQPESELYARCVAAVAIALDRPDQALAATREIHAGEQVALAPLFLRAAALSYDRRTQEESEKLFVQAIRALPPATAAIFVDGEGLLPGVDPGDVDAAVRFFERIDSTPALRSNARRLAYWRRILQADLFFGRAEDGLPGWKTAPGERWVRWGRPVAVDYEPAEPGVFYTARSTVVGKGGSRSEPDSLESRNDRDPRIARWRWTYSIHGEPVVVTFQDLSLDHHWGLASRSALDVEALQRELPLVFTERAIPSGFELWTDLIGYLHAADRDELDVAVGIGPLRPDEGGAVVAMPDTVVVDWAVFGQDGVEIDRGDLVLTAADSRARRLGALPDEHRVSGLPDLRLGHVVLELPPGAYRVAVEARDPSTGGQRWTKSQVVLSARPGVEPSMSDLRLAASFAPYLPTSEVPLAFVRHALVVLPLPERRVPVGIGDFFVYYELYDLGVDAAGRTLFDVSYRIERLFDDLADASQRSGELQPKMRRFVEESTSVSAAGVVVKGTRVDLDGLDVGRYRIVVEVEDHHSKTRFGQSATFRIVPAEGVR